MTASRKSAPELEDDQDKLDPRDSPSGSSSSSGSSSRSSSGSSRSSSEESEATRAMFERKLIVLLSELLGTENCKVKTNRKRDRIKRIDGLPKHAQMNRVCRGEYRNFLVVGEERERGGGEVVGVTAEEAQGARSATTAIATGSTASKAAKESGKNNSKKEAKKQAGNKKKKNFYYDMDAVVSRRCEDEGTASRELLKKAGHGWHEVYMNESCVVKVWRAGLSYWRLDVPISGSVEKSAMEIANKCAGLSVAQILAEGKCTRPAIFNHLFEDDEMNIDRLEQSITAGNSITKNSEGSTASSQEEDVEWVQFGRLMHLTKRGMSGEAAKGIMNRLIVSDEAYAKIWSGSPNPLWPLKENAGVKAEDLVMLHLMAKLGTCLEPFGADFSLFTIKPFLLLIAFW